LEKQKLLIVTSRFPYPTDKGDKLRAYHQIIQLSKTFDIYLFSLSTEKVDENSKEALSRYCKQIDIHNITFFVQVIHLFRGIVNHLPFQVNYFYSKNALQRLQYLIETENIEMGYFQLIRTAEYAKNLNLRKKALDYMDALSLGMERRKNVAPFYLKPIMQIETNRLKKFERNISDTFQQAFFIAEKDKQVIIPINCPFQIIANGVELNNIPTLVDKKYTIAFTGNMSYPPNVDAALFLAEQIMPLLWKTLPEAILVIAGTSPTSKILALKSEKIVVTGRVPDMSIYYLASKIFVAPMRIGSGLQNKLLEAMSFGIPCITSDLANDALKAEPNKEILVSISAESFSENMIELLLNETLYQQLSERGFTFVKEKYSWEKNTEPIVKFFLEINND
jgi:polysaccharide biosynthesis protein PslH